MRTVSPTASEKGLRAAITRNGGETDPLEELSRPRRRPSTPFYIVFERKAESPALFNGKDRSGSKPTSPEPKPPTIAPFTAADANRIAALPAAQQLKAIGDELTRRNPLFNGVLEGPLAEPTPRIDRSGVVTGLRFATDHVADLSPLRALRGLKELEATAAGDTGRLVDLSPLAGLPLTKLRVYGNPGIADLSPLKGMALTMLDIDRTSVANIEVLKGMPLRRLSLCDTRVSELAPVAGMSFDWLHVHGSRVRTLNGVQIDSVKWLSCTLAQMPDEDEWKRFGVEELWISRADLAADAARLRALGPRLTRINGDPADELLKMLEKKPQQLLEVAPAPRPKK